MIEALKKLGVEPGKPLDASKLDPAVLKGINEAPAEVNKQFVSGPYEMKTVNGWLNMLNLGAYGDDYKTRAFIANVGLGVLPKEDAVYPSAFVDATGTALDCTHKYVMHFPKEGVPYRDNFYVRAR